MITRIVHWKHTDMLALFDRPLVCITANNRVVTLKKAKNNHHWLWLVSKYNIMCWCFASELIPEKFQ